MHKALKRIREQDRSSLLVNIALGHKDIDLAWLTDAIGFDATLQLILVFGGEKIKLPKAQDLLDALNAASAALEVHEGLRTPPEAAKHYNVSTQAVNKVLKTVQEYEDQLGKARRLVDSELRRKT